MVYNTQNYWVSGSVIQIRRLMLALSKGPNKVGVSLTSPEDGNRSSFRNVVFSSDLGFRTMDKVQKPSDSERIYNVYIHIYEYLYYITTTCTENGRVFPHGYSNSDNVKCIHISLFIFLFSCNEKWDLALIYQKQQAIFKKKNLTTYIL
jgi:hypothetical protein